MPWRHTHDPYRVLVAEVMLQQTQVERVLPKYAQWLERFPTLASLAEAAPAEVIRQWAPLGYNGRAVRLQAIARTCEARFGGQLPATLPELLELKGVGRYTAGAIACFALGQQLAFWDTNVQRVLSRSLLGSEEPPRPTAMQRLADAALPPACAYQWHQALMDLGATICRARTPLCGACPASNACAAYPARRDGELRLAERRTPYAAQPFRTTSRYFRGRVVDLLREQSPRALEEVLARLGRDDLPWLNSLLAALERDGLVRLADGTVSLP
ncbi:MAG: A/G-specific adenine glycosylase [Chloroflexota bacterium]